MNEVAALLFAISVIRGCRNLPGDGAAGCTLAADTLFGTGLGVGRGTIAVAVVDDISRI